MDKELDAIMFAVNEKAEAANKLMNEANELGSEKTDYQFNKGQFQAYSEIYTMLNNIK